MDGMHIKLLTEVTSGRGTGEYVWTRACVYGRVCGCVWQVAWEKQKLKCFGLYDSFCLNILQGTRQLTLNKRRNGLIGCIFSKLKVKIWSWHTPKSLTFSWIAKRKTVLESVLQCQKNSLKKEINRHTIQWSVVNSVGALLSAPSCLTQVLT